MPNDYPSQDWKELGGMSFFFFFFHSSLLIKNGFEGIIRAYQTQNMMNPLLVTKDFFLVTKGALAPL